ncbi:galactose oxidase [Gigaspora margarita]|uniref:Galactose oxidase n=1 Tax=Gigaspora margarita TaxID=4874 RepID=A0A8H4A050_GIGMA|nr:galactose oxidase [Gigaspora margarita]
MLVLYEFGNVVILMHYNASQQFNITLLPWKDITFTGDLRISGASACSGRNNIYLFIFGESTWSLSNASNASPAIWSYCAITLLDETILYIGGCFMMSLPLYDSTSDTWKSLDTSSPTPPSRRAFSAVLTSDKRIIIFGGLDENFSALGF